MNESRNNEPRRPDCVTEVRPQILKIGIPGLYNVNAWWDQEAKRKERAR